MLDRAHLMFSVVAVLGLAASAAACTKSEGPPSGTTASASTKEAPPPTATATASAEPSAAEAASAAPSASAAATAATAAATATATAAATATATATAAATATATVAPKASAAAGKDDLTAANAACGTKPLPDCPLQAWMKANTNPAIASNDLPALTIALDKAASMGPAAYGNWASIAKDGAKAAKAGDMTAAKASCRTCHDQYKTKYKAELRGRKI